MVKGCTQRKGYAWIKSSTTNIRNHLIHDHKLNEKTPAEGSRLTGALEAALTNLGKRTAAQFSKQEFERQFCKVLVRHQLPYTLVESQELLELLKMAQSAASQDDIQLPSNDTIAKRVCQTESKQSG